MRWMTRSGRGSRVGYARRAGGAPGSALLAGAVLAGLSACGGGSGSGSTASSATAVAAVTLTPQSVEVERRWTGRLEPLRVVPVQSPREGRVAAVQVRDGDRVRAGDILLRMEGPDLEARRDGQSQRLAQLEEELARWEALAGTGAAGAGEVAAATLRVLEAREQTAQLEAAMEEYRLRSPSAGVVHNTVVTRGVNVAAGQILLQVDDASSLGVRLVVSAGETAWLEDPSMLEVRDDRGQELVVERVVLSSDPHPAFVRADLYLGGSPESVRRGVTVRYRSSEEMLLLPWTALASDGTRQWVGWIAPPTAEGEPHRVERRTVELGRAHADGVEVLAGLDPGDQVIRYEPRSHAEGRAVRPVERNGGAGGAQ
jgi:membrane fusion protein, multidrug efflux system